ncbi:unnamed protein product [Rhizoctonia solani]|uniref:Uncharacterized protein n=1 Tax=Rhizoctonia solani TaxID=456999 RepID=A0A8H3GF56_9AGAM|nr:unnamed protein product [Rhizoctonia solani]
MLSLLFVIPWFAAVSGHSAFWHPSMYGFNVSQAPDGRDNRPVAPLRDLDFNVWWMHGHMDAPPNKGDVFRLPAGQTVTTEIACTKAATSYWESGEGGDVRDGNNVCPGSPMAQFHTNGISGLGGCGLAIAYKNDVHAVKPEDFAIFSVNHQCVWNRFTDFEVPAKLPECPGGKCICSFFWIHREDSGGEEMYMNPFDCAVANATSSVPIPPPQVPRYCPVDKTNCTVGAKQPFYWLQNEGNNIFNDSFDPPTYTDDYGFKQGAQNDLWDSVAGASSTTSTASATLTSGVAPSTTPGSRVAAVSSNGTSSDPNFPDVADLVGSSGSNTTISPLNNTEGTPSNNHGVHSTSPVQHLLAGSSRKIRGCNAYQVSGQGKQKRNHVIRKRTVKNGQSGWSWW